MIYPKRRTRKGRLLSRNGKMLRCRQMGKYNMYVENKYGEDYYVDHVLRINGKRVAETVAQYMEAV